jgi:hypothetical protein
MATCTGSAGHFLAYSGGTFCAPPEAAPLCLRIAHPRRESFSLRILEGEELLGGHEVGILDELAAH